LRMIGWPMTRVEGYFQLGEMYAQGAKDPDKALVAFRQALALAPEAQRPAVLQRIPKPYWAKLGYPEAAP
jgi:O-antigen ligase